MLADELAAQPVGANGFEPAAMRPVSACTRHIGIVVPPSELVSAGPRLRGSPGPGNSWRLPAASRSFLTGPACPPPDPGHPRPGIAA